MFFFEELKINDKIDDIFGMTQDILKYKVEGFDFSLFYTNKESQYSSLLPKHVKQVNDIMKRWFANPLYIIDATAHIGVDTVHFAKMYPMATIESFEIKLFWIDDVYVGILGRYINADFLQIWNRYIVIKEIYKFFI